jgi:hypothetical protein
MKKLIVVLTVCVFAVTGKVSAQAPPPGKPAFQDLHLTSKLKEGENKVPLRRSRSLAITMRLNVITKVEFIDSMGVRTLLSPTRGGANGAPNPECKTKLPDVCFSSPDKNIGLCICKPTDLSNGEGEYTIKFRRGFVSRFGQ